jgi:hypothetical protein
MTDLLTSLTPAVIREIIAQLDQSIALIEKSNGRLTAYDIQLKSMLSALRSRMSEHLRRFENHPVKYYPDA